MIARALGEKAEEADAFWGDGDKVRRIVAPGSSGPVGARPASHARARRSAAAAGLALASGRKRLRSPRRYGPSRLSSPVDRVARQGSLVYGTAMHLLLQHLPDQPPERREMQRPVPSLRRAARRSRSICMTDSSPNPSPCMALPDLAPLFAPEARAEVAVIGALNSGRRQPARHTRQRRPARGDAGPARSPPTSRRERRKTRRPAPISSRWRFTAACWQSCGRTGRSSCSSFGRRRRASSNSMPPRSRPSRRHGSGRSHRHARRGTSALPTFANPRNFGEQGLDGRHRGAFPRFSTRRSRRPMASR